jgi:hypothetical protein
MDGDQSGGNADMRQQIDELRSRLEAAEQRADASESRADKIGVARG